MRHPHTVNIVMCTDFFKTDDQEGGVCVSLCVCIYVCQLVCACACVYVCVEVGRDFPCYDFSFMCMCVHV